MTAGDIFTYIASVDDDGTKLETVLAGKIVVADTFSVTKISGNRVCVVVVKAA